MSEDELPVLDKLGYSITNVLGGVERWPGLFVRTKRFKC